MNVHMDSEVVLVQKTPQTINNKQTNKIKQKHTKDKQKTPRTNQITTIHIKTPHKPLKKHKNNNQKTNSPRKKPAKKKIYIQKQKQQATAIRKNNKSCDSITNIVLSSFR